MVVSGSSLTGDRIFENGRGDTRWDPAYVIEENSDGNVTVLIPWSPASFAGSIKVVARERIELLDTNVGDFSRALGNWGVGIGEILGKSSSGKETDTRRKNK